jgi:DNA polymerase-2
MGYKVIYGDTDSVFVLLSAELGPEACDQLGRNLASDLTAHFQTKLRTELRLESHLELEYETHFRRFLMPTMRGSEIGTKKRYAGATVDSKGETKIVFKGLEAVRTDWTPLARSFQRELFRRVFADEPYKPFLCSTAAELFQGKLDDQLVYRKRLMRKVDEYVKNVPPHVQAARKLPKQGRSIEYFITLAGPEPRQALKSPLDYDHYFERQLAPAADSLLHFLGEEFSAIAGRQMSLFGR